MLDEKKRVVVGGVNIKINVDLQESPEREKPPKVYAYAFTGTGRYIATAAVDDKGSASLAVPATKARQEVRIVVGPETSGKSPSLSDLTRRGAQTDFVQIGVDGQVSPVAFRIPSEIWRCWIRLCFVNGQLLKHVISGGEPIDFPVCNANVQIWEVEPIEFIIARLPDLELEGIRRAILSSPPSETPALPVNPNPPDPAPFHSLSLRSARVQLAQPVGTVTSALQDSADLANLRAIATTANPASFRQALIANISVARIFLCELIPRWVTKTLVATTTTDRCGNFEEVIFLSCYSPNPNLYFTASISFFGFEIGIYDPVPVACYTYWGYQCGTQVTLYTCSIFAPTCSPCQNIDAPENYVLIRAIGNQPLSQIYGTGIYGGSNPTLPRPTTAANIGLLADYPTAGDDAPFGGLLLPRIEFDNTLRDNNLANYYQMSVRVGTSGPWTLLTGQIDRHYNIFVGTNLVTEPYNLGPKTVNSQPNMFEIPTALPPPGGSWAFPNLIYDLANAQFDTTTQPVSIVGGTNGVYQLMLELFDSSANPVNIAAAGIAYFVPTFTDASQTIHTVDASTLGLVTGNSFIMTLHIDNRPTTGSLATPAIGGVHADPTCGVLSYTDTSSDVDMQFDAAHPANFANYYWQLSRGGSNILLKTGNVGPASNPGEVDASVSSLLGSCAIAGFAEALIVEAWATDGWDRLDQYDSGPQFVPTSPQYIAPQGFVLAPSS